MVTFEVNLVQSYDLPALYRSADAASIQAQKYYRWLVLLDLTLMMVGALATSFAIPPPNHLTPSPCQPYATLKSTTIS